MGNIPGGNKTLGVNLVDQNGYCILVIKVDIKILSSDFHPVDVFSLKYNNLKSYSVLPVKLIIS